MTNTGAEKGVCLLSHDSPIRDYTTRHLFRPLHLFFMLPLAAFLRVTDLSSAVVRKQLVPTNPSALVVGLVTCIVTLLILALLATRNRSEEKKPMLVPGIFCLIVSLAISLGTTLTPQSILANILSGIPMTPLPPTMFASVILVGVGITLFTVAWAHAYQSLDRDTIFVNTAIAFALANALDGTLARFATDMDPLVVAASLVLLSALPLELILSGGKGDGGTGLGQGNGASGTVGQGDGGKFAPNPPRAPLTRPPPPPRRAVGARRRSPK
jgi:hypothetical protein